MSLQRQSLSNFQEEKLGLGEVTFTATEAAARLGITHGAFLDAAERLQRQGQLLRLRRGFYLIVPPQFRSFGAPPPSWYIDELMRSIGLRYYVGMLKAAELHGAAHQAVMEFQVVTNRQLKPISAGRTRITFYYRKDLAAVMEGMEAYKTDSGRMWISSPELTAWDLLRYPQASGGLNPTATVLSELGPKLRGEQLAALAPAFERTALQRLGYLLERVGQAGPARALVPLVALANPAWVELDPADASDPDFAPSPTERDPRWRVIVRREPELDQ